jgi:hypothetical protein
MLSTVANVVGQAQLGVGVDCGPRPNVVLALRLLLRRDVLFLRADELPDFIALQAANANIAHMAMMVGGTVPAKIAERLRTVCFATPVIRQIPLMEHPRLTPPSRVP